MHIVKNKDQIIGQTVQSSLLAFALHHFLSCKRINTGSIFDYPISVSRQENSCFQKILTKYKVTPFFPPQTFLINLFHITLGWIHFQQKQFQLFFVQWGSTQGINESANFRFLQTVRHIWLPPRLTAISCFLPRLLCLENSFLQILYWRKSHFNPIALRKAEIVYKFHLSECSRVKAAQINHFVIL